jgi:hypothetical protein
MNDSTIEDDEANSSILDVNQDGEVDFDDVKIVVLRYEWILLSGILLILVPIVDMSGYYPIPDTVYWMLAGICLSVEAVIELYLDRKRRNW